MFVNHSSRYDRAPSLPRVGIYCVAAGALLSGVTSLRVNADPPEELNCFQTEYISGACEDCGGGVGVDCPGGTFTCLHDIKTNESVYRKFAATTGLSSWTDISPWAKCELIKVRCIAHGGGWTCVSTGIIVSISCESTHAVGDNCPQ